MTKKNTIVIADRRAQLVVQCGCELLGLQTVPDVEALQLPLSVAEFQTDLRTQYAARHPELVCRSDSTLERARLERRRLPTLPRVLLRQGAPRRPAG